MIKSLVCYQPFNNWKKLLTYPTDRALLINYTSGALLKMRVRELV